MATLTYIWKEIPPQRITTLIAITTKINGGTMRMLSKYIIAFLAATVLSSCNQILSQPTQVDNQMSAQFDGPWDYIDAWFNVKSVDMTLNKGTHKLSGPDGVYSAYAVFVTTECRECASGEPYLKVFSSDTSIASIAETKWIGGSAKTQHYVVFIDTPVDYIDRRAKTGVARITATVYDTRGNNENTSFLFTTSPDPQAPPFKCIPPNCPEA